MENCFDYLVVGGGIVGLATAHEIRIRHAKVRVGVVEKENRVALHQTGRNSGVLHSGVYYRPGSLKARLCIEGGKLLERFCEREGVRMERCGKLIVATRSSELPILNALYVRAVENGISVRRMSPSDVKEIEPHVSCLAAVHVPSTGIVDFAQVCEKLMSLIVGLGGEVRLGSEVHGIHLSGAHHFLETSQGDLRTRVLINCAGLQSDRVAKMGGSQPNARIIPFRGEYYQLKSERCNLVRHLIYPVPDPQFPFLGVHLTRMIDGGVHAGPNAVLSLKREGYSRTSFSWRDFLEIVTFPGFWRFAVKHPKTGLGEIHRSLSKSAFTRSLQRLVPGIRKNDLIPAKSGVRAQALWRDGSLVDDFLIVRDGSTVHVCNAPSPAATASLEIGRMIADQVPLP